MSKPNSDKLKHSVSVAERKLADTMRERLKRDAYRRKMTILVYVPRFNDGTYGMPFYCPSDSVAATCYRSCLDSDPEPLMVKSDLYCIGEYHLDTGTIKGLPHRFISF